MFNVFASFLPVIVCASQLLRTCVCDVWDDADQRRMLDDIIPELYEKYRKALDGTDEATFTFRRALKNNKEYTIHINRLKAVNGLKKHNLIIKEKSDNNPLIYINNPVETKIPNAYLSLEGFKELLTGRVQQQRNEFKKMYKTTSKSSLNKPNRVHYTKKKTKQTKPYKYVAPVTKNTKKNTKNTVKTKNTAREITKIKVPFTTILVNNKLERSGTTQLKASEPVAKPNTVLIDAIGKTSRAKPTVELWSTVDKSTAGEIKTEEPISKKSTTEESITNMPTLRESSDRLSQLTQITTTEKSTIKEIINEQSITNEPTLDEVTMEKATIVKLNTVKSEISTADKSTFEHTEEPTIDLTTTETTLHVLRTINITEAKSEEIRNKELIEVVAFNTTEISNLDETTILDPSETLNIENNITAESKESNIIELATKVLTTMQEITTEPTKLTTDQLYPKRKTTTEEPSVEVYLPKWTKRPTTIRTTTLTTKATTKRRTLGRPLVYMGDMEG